MTRKTFIEVKIGDISQYNETFSRYQKTKNWVKQWWVAYGFSSDDISQLTLEEKETVEDILSSDPLAISEKWIIDPPTPLKGGVLEIELFESECPKSCENFASLCKGGRVGKSSKKPLHYENNRMFRLVPNFVIQGGDVTRDDGSGGDSIYNGKFNDEKPGLAKKFNRKGIVAMANSGKNSNTSQFFVTLSEQHPQYDKINGKYVIFGQVSKGLEVLDDINTVSASNEQPLETITITRCGEL
ncbi:cyclophilin-like domain-containing protein [Sporodiniella umbellata]|nr:cyclophilin-like domain-containing protein [Sporodiniella umbellata]